MTIEIRPAFHAPAFDVNALLTAHAAELAYKELDEQMNPMDYDEGPPASLCAAHAALFAALDKAPEPEPDYSEDLPF